MIYYYLVLENVCKWNIENLNEEQVFEKPDYGLKFVIPASSVEVWQEVTTEVKVVAPEESEIIHVNQIFKSYDNFDVVKAFDFGVFDVVKQMVHTSFSLSTTIFQLCYDIIL